MSDRLTMDRAARRFSQIAELERKVGVVEAEISDANEQVSQAQDVVKDLRDKKRVLLEEMRKCARDEGELPLFSALDLDVEGQ